MLIKYHQKLTFVLFDNFKYYQTFLISGGFDVDGEFAWMYDDENRKLMMESLTGAGQNSTFK